MRALARTLNEENFFHDLISIVAELVHKGASLRERERQHGPRVEAPHGQSAAARYDCAQAGYIAGVQSPDFNDHPSDHAALDDCAPRIRVGDAAAFERLFRALHAPLVRFATRYSDAARAEEIVQDVFFAIWQTRTEWTPRGSVRAYLYGAVRNRALNLQRRDALEQDWAAEEVHDETRTLHAARYSADVELEQAELVSLAQAALDALPERCRLVMQLRWREGLSYAEIAEVMGIGTKGVENQLSRGLRAVRTKVLGG